MAIEEHHGFDYEMFISYSPQGWQVEVELAPRLRQQGLRLCIDRQCLSASLALRDGDPAGADKAGTLPATPQIRQAKGRQIPQTPPMNPQLATCSL